ncbi:MAG: CU044_2847 family protein [Armatimonadota bacterium]|nr:CU044_2847 family protein [Armatimonadota bacterium]MDR7563865.1 CU044_2847 family protein [Armatimonadota bacterium]MDR7567633.1 CU044_2847 family protein [Armatimonadota bacterium]MDR7602611.1 CU044_2847 family protein [Armatimonadota bacterium]
MHWEQGTEVVAVRLPDGQRLLVEAVSFDRVTEAARGVRELDQAWNEVADIVRAAGQSVVDAFEKLRPDRVAVEFGVKLAVESGRLTALLVKGTADASLKVTLEWSGATE